MIGGISKKLLATIVSWVVGAVSILGFVFFGFPASNLNYAGINNYKIMSIGFNPYLRAPWTILGISILNLFILIILIASLLITIIANIKFIKFRYLQTLSYLIISVLSFLSLIFTIYEGEYRFSLTMGIMFFCLTCLNGYFNLLLFKGELKDLD